MMDLFPDRYEIARCATDGRERKLVKKRIV
jgi:hypothetical protein